MYHAEVVINLKKGVADPEGMSTKKALGMLGFKVKDVSVAKIFRITLEAKNKSDAEKKVVEMCRKLLANPVIHDYRITLKPQDCSYEDIDNGNKRESKHLRSL